MNLIKLEERFESNILMFDNLIFASYIGQHRVFKITNKTLPRYPHRKNVCRMGFKGKRLLQTWSFKKEKFFEVLLTLTSDHGTATQGITSFSVFLSPIDCANDQNSMCRVFEVTFTH